MAILFRGAIAASMLAASLLPAMAQGRPDARTMSCERVHALIAERGAVVLTTGRHTYDRYVLDGRFCDMREVARPITIPTKGGEACVVLECRDEPFADW
ncbi:MAG TPA: hypothetical protein PL183_02665 [Aquamicrobium sp.]|jgi:calcineurin-like phosphoesterase|nr:hypothetical protein [Aquamicrobium sp.]